MVNINGNLENKEQAHLSLNNRGYHYGDAVFETIKVVHGEILYLEDHYFRLMSSMRILRMEIPMQLTLEFFESEIKKTISASSFSDVVRVKFSVHRVEGGLYLPKVNTVEYMITLKPIEDELYVNQEQDYIVDLYKDYFIAPNLLSTVKTTNRVVNVLGSIYAKENDYHNCLLLNTNKHVIEALNGNLFLVKGNVVKTPPLSDGCIKGIMRKQIIEAVNKIEDYILEEASISPFELQKADELFITNTIIGIQPIMKYRKKSFKRKVSTLLLEKINEKISYKKDPQEH